MENNVRNTRYHALTPYQALNPEQNPVKAYDDGDAYVRVPQQMFNWKNTLHPNYRRSVIKDKFCTDHERATFDPRGDRIQKLSSEQIRDFLDLLRL